MNATEQKQMVKLKKEIDSWVRLKGIRNVMHRTAKNLLPGIKFGFMLNTGGMSFTDGKKITVGVPEFAWTHNKETLFAVTKALVGHETEHIWSSDFDVFKSFQGEVQKHFRTEHNLRIGKQLGAQLLNAVEDGRIEKRLINRYQGYKKHIQLMNGIIWDTSPCPGENMMNEFLWAIATVSCSGIKPKEWDTHHAGTEADELIEQIRPLILQAINNPTARGCADDTMEIVKVISPFIATLLEDEKNEQALNEKSDKPDFTSSSPQEGQEHQPGTSQSSHFLESDSPGGAPSDEDAEESEEKDAKGNGEEKEGENQDDDKDKDDEKKEGKSKDEEKPLTPEEIKDMVQQAIEELTEELSDEAEREMEVGEKEAERERQAEAKENTYTGHLEPEETRGIDPHVNFYQKDPQSVRYDEPPIESIKKGQLLNRELKKVLLNKQAYNSRNRRAGQLDMNNLWKKGVKEYDMFVKKGVPKLSNYVVNVLVDASGSMNSMGCSKTRKTKMSLALDATVMLEEALRDIAPLRVTHFSASTGSIDHSTVKDFDQNAKKPLTWKRVSSANVRANRDGYSIKVAVKELEKRSEQKKILIILSDGLPVYPSVSYGQKEVREAVRDARKEGMIVIAIAFGSEEEREQNREVYKEMYQKGIIMVDSDQIHKHLGKVIKNEIK